MPKGVYKRSEATKEKIKDNLVKARNNSPIMEGMNSMKEPNEFVGKSIEFTLKLNEMYGQPPDRKNIKEMEQRFVDYLKLCMDYDFQPGNMACYTALGITKQDADRWESGQCGTTLQSDFIKKVKQIISTFRENAANEGKINTVWAIFMGKNYDGLKDQQDVVVTPNVIGQTDDPTTLAEKYRDDLPEITE